MAALAALAAVVGQPRPVVAQGAGADYASRSACERANRYTREQCDNAFVNALAEFEEGTPRFSKRGECEKRFGRCQIAGFGSGKVTFGPTMEKVVITQRGGNVTVVPVLGQGRTVVPFAERTILQRKAERSDRKQAEAQKRWEASWAIEAAPPSDASAGGVPTPGGPEPFDENWRKQEGVAKYPVPSSMKKPRGGAESN